MIKEVIVVEGRDDEARLREACECESIATHGFGLSPETVERIKYAYETKGIIIFTDPDFAGEKIRKRLTKMFPGSKHAYLTQNEARKNNDIGIENASVESIMEALEKACCETLSPEVNFTIKDLMENGMTYGKGAKEKREFIGKILGIGYGNNKEFIRRLNNYEIKKEAFYGALQEWDNREDKR